MIFSFMYILQFAHFYTSPWSLLSPTHLSTLAWAFSFPKQHPHPQILKITEDTQYLYLFCSQILIGQNRTKIHPHTKVIMSRGKLRYLFLTTLLRREAMVGTHGAREPLGTSVKMKVGIQDARVAGCGHPDSGIISLPCLCSSETFMVGSTPPREFHQQCKAHIF